MVECEICGESVSGGSVFTCTYCGGTFCPAHRLPFNHACTRIEDWRRSKPAGKKYEKGRMPMPGLFYDKKLIIAAGIVVVSILLLAFWFLQ
jgi:uncharacterized membrane protein YvbJ